MRPLSGILSALAVLVILAAPASGQEAAADRYLAEMNTIADALDGITDQQSAAAAAETMGAALARLGPISAEMQAWSEDEKMNFLRNYSEAYIGAHTRISQALAKMVQYPERMKLFTEHMKNMPRLD